MKTREAFKQKMNGEVARAEAELERFTALGMGFTGTAKKTHDMHVAQLEQKVDDIKARLRDIATAEENSWENLRDVVTNTWEVLQAALQHAIETIKTEPPVPGLHGNDEGDYPYGDGLSGRPTGKNIIDRKR